MRLKVTTVQIMEVPFDDQDSILAFRDSLMNGFKAGEGVGCETEDTEFTFTPVDTISVEVEAEVE